MLLGKASAKVAAKQCWMDVVKLPLVDQLKVKAALRLVVAIHGTLNILESW